MNSEVGTNARIWSPYAKDDIREQVCMEKFKNEYCTQFLSSQHSLYERELNITNPVWKKSVSSNPTRTTQNPTRTTQNTLTGITQKWVKVHLHYSVWYYFLLCIVCNIMTKSYKWEHQICESTPGKLNFQTFSPPFSIFLHCPVACGGNIHSILRKKMKL